VNFFISQDRGKKDLCEALGGKTFASTDVRSAFQERPWLHEMPHRGGQFALHRGADSD